MVVIVSISWDFIFCSFHSLAHTRSVGVWRYLNVPTVEVIWGILPGRLHCVHPSWASLVKNGLIFCQWHMCGHRGKFLKLYHGQIMAVKGRGTRIFIPHVDTGDHWWYRNMIRSIMPHVCYYLKNTVLTAHSLCRFPPLLKIKKCHSCRGFILVQWNTPELEVGWNFWKIVSVRTMKDFVYFLFILHQGETFMDFAFMVGLCSRSWVDTISFLCWFWCLKEWS